MDMPMLKNNTTTKPLNQNKMKREKQYEDSARVVGYAMLGGILTLIGLIIYNCIVYGIN